MSTTRYRVAALLSAATLTTAAISAAPASAQAGSVHGCPSGYACIYPSQAAYNNNAPIDRVLQPTTIPRMYHSVAMLIPDALVNNTDPFWTSEGKSVADIPGVLCTVQVDLNDVQAPDTTEDPADGASVDVMLFGPTREDVSGLAGVVTLTGAACS
ncbi:MULTISPECIES: hypothetical protein [unclassified Nocardia]|uniref:hypothetical protein n=1 Tax=unclassified Nocardia TaxID=2637762 RepID=UPI001CE47D66|nr:MULTISPECIES: hypothetical protein [unclassified Nocardia]